MQLESLRFVMLGASDVERSVAFYRDTLGLPMTGRFEGFAFFNTGETTLALSAELGQRAAAFANAELVFGARSVTGAYARLREAGVEFLNEPRQVNDANWAVNFMDPDGHLLSVYGAR